MRFLDKYVSRAVCNHHFMQWSKSNRTKTFLDMVTASDIAYENSNEVWKEELQIRATSTTNDDRRKATREKNRYHEGRGKRLNRTILDVPSVSSWLLLLMVDDRKKLEKRVSNGDKLDTADEATLSKLSAAQESHKKHGREHKRSNVDDRKKLEKRVSNGKKLTTAEEATLSKLTAAHESKKNMIVRDYEEKG
jgi:hypothetical protein